MPITNWPNGASSFGIPLVGNGVPIPKRDGKVWFVDGTNGADGNKGQDPSLPLATISRAIALAGNGDTIFVFPKKMLATDTDPNSYAETITITQPDLSLIGVARGRTQGGLPQMKKGSGSTAHITVRAPGVLIANMGINGGSSTGGGILLDDDGGSTKSAFGASITGCHFKNCVGSTATNAATGGAIMWSSAGNAWQVHIKGNRFYKNVGDIVLMGTSGSVPQDVVIEDNIFSGPAASVDCNVYLAGGSGMLDVIVRNNFFPAVDGCTLSNAVNAVYVDMTGCTGLLAGNTFACLTNDAATELTFKAASGTGGKIPLTVRMAQNFGESSTVTEAAEAIIYRHA